MRKLCYLIFNVFLVCPLFSFSAETLDSLLLSVKEDQGIVKKFNRDREARFLEKQKEQSQLLDLARIELKNEEKITQKLTEVFEKNEKSLADLEQKLNLAVGQLGEMFGVVRQTAGELNSEVKSSIISAEMGGHEEFLSRIADSRVLPVMSDLEHLWFALQQEMTESGKIKKFKAHVVTPEGLRSEKQITRVGTFNLVAEGRYLIFQSETKQIMELSRQPSDHFLSMVEEMESQSSEKSSKNSSGNMIAFAVDPSRGSILSLLVQAPSLVEKIQQGGIVGYVIIAILFLGLGLVAERFVVLKRESQSIQKQMDSETIIEDNALGKVMSVFAQSQSDDLETIELKLDEVILKKTPELTRGIGTIKILSGVAPLLGLLGTVTGMIVTFQSITLFGTGDPKLMAGGISQALVTTVLGLVCAIPLVLLHNVISNKSRRIIQILEEQSAGLIAEKMGGIKI